MQKWVQVTFAGIFGGLIAWLVGELIFGKFLASELTLAQRLALDAGYGLVTGILLGICLGIGHWVSFRRWWLPLLAAALGAIGGLVGLLWGEVLYQLLRFAELLARPVGWTLFGFVLGSSQGVARGSSVGALRAGLGGGIGAGIGGLLFALLPSLTGLPDPSCRGIAWVLMGALIGSGSALVERLLAGATLKVVSGKLEGKEFILDKHRLTIGRDERCDIPIYYDRQIAPRHATLEWTGAGYRIAPIGNATVVVNGQTVPIKELSHNDIVQLGNTRLIYRLRTGSPLVYLCSTCYTPNRKDAKFCRNCGKPFVPLDLPKETVGQWMRQLGIALGALLICLGTSYSLGQWMGRNSQNLTRVVTPTQSPAEFAQRWQQRPLRLAVTPPGYDDIGSVLQRIGFAPENIGLWDIRNLNRLRLYDAVFVNCHHALIDFADGQAIAQYVAEGGILYASDYACSVIEAAFPQVLKFGFSGIFAFFGEAIDAEVIDPTLMDFVGTKLRLNFDLPGWRHVERWHPSCRVSLITKSWLSTKALLVSFSYGRGFVVYTAFHNKAQPSEIERRLIEFLAVRPLTMRLSRQVAEEIQRPIEVGALGERKAGGLLSGTRIVMRREIVGTLTSGQNSPIYRFALARSSPVKIVVGWEGGDGDFSVTLWQETQPHRRWQQGAKSPPLVLTISELLPPGNYCLQLTAVKAPLLRTPFVIGVGAEP